MRLRFSTVKKVAYAYDRNQGRNKREKGKDK